MVTQVGCVALKFVGIKKSFNLLEQLHDYKVNSRDKMLPPVNKLTWAEMEFPLTGA